MEIQVLARMQVSGGDQGRPTIGRFELLVEEAWPVTARMLESARGRYLATVIGGAQMRGRISEVYLTNDQRGMLVMELIGSLPADVVSFKGPVKLCVHLGTELTGMVRRRRGNRQGAKEAQRGYL